MARGRESGHCIRKFAIGKYPGKRNPPLHAARTRRSKGKHFITEQTCSPPMRRLPPLLRRAWYSLNQAFRQRIAPLGITPDQYSILRWLHEGNPQGLTQSEITLLMASDAATITATVSRMEKNQLLQRIRHESDRRAKRVQLLPRGSQIFHQAHSIALDLQSVILRDLSQEDTSRFLALLEQVADECARQSKTLPETAQEYSRSTM
jgi:DNA-binding MarR family transcriptional regulator